MEYLYILYDSKSHWNKLDFQVSAVFGRGSQVVHHPVTFKSRAAYVALPQLKAYSSTNIYFQFKTLQPSGLLMFNGGKGKSFRSLLLLV